MTTTYEYTDRWTQNDRFFHIHSGLVDTDKHWYVSTVATAPEWAKEMVRYCQSFHSEEAAFQWLETKLTAHAE